ncbi:serine hydrolase domain-containing protein [Demequina flava]|uniref:serine hydrolase domain-containing protein n=1 Tax=Demequina flava TaxID=1095025 RepID=UPI0007861256|nr:serine hydrolase [Demequina flava]
MSRKSIVALIVAAALVLTVIAVYWYQRPMLLTGTGYAAHNECAVTHVAGRDGAADDLPPNPLIPVMRTTSIDDDTASTGAVLGVLAKQTAWNMDEFGCTVADERPDSWGSATAVTADDNPYAGLPEVATDDSGLADALAHGFGDDLDDTSREELGTRAIVVLQGGELIAERYADGFDPTTPQLGWSMTKSVTNLLVGRLVEQGEVSLDDAALVDDWSDERAEITIRHLLEMTSGLAWDETYDLGTPITQMLYAEEDMGAYVASQELAHEPGTYLQYSSGSTTLLCDAITNGRGLADFPRREIFAPLGLSTAVLEADATGNPVCSSYMWASARDWASIGQFALQDGVWNDERLLPEGWIAESTTPVTTATTVEADGYASSWWSNTSADGSVVNDELPADAYFASGHDGQKITVVPSQDLVVVRLGFTPTADDNRAFSTSAQIIEALGGN